MAPTRALAFNFQLSTFDCDFAEILIFFDFLDPRACEIRPATQCPDPPATRAMSGSTASPLIRAKALFESQFGSTAGTVAAVAPGRVNLIGEHVDYNAGFVMPIAISRNTAIVGRKSSSGTYRLVLPNLKSPNGGVLSKTWPSKSAFFDKSGPVEWHHYVRGVVALLEQKGISVPPFEASIVGNVPLGGGLSSSASLEVVTATFVEALSGRTIDKVDKAKLCQMVEHKWCGVPCGIMDQYISVCGQKDCALLIDCKDNTFQAVSMKNPKLSILISNTHVKHALVDGGYKARRASCEAAAEKLGVSSLREIDGKTLASRGAKAGLSITEFVRAQHVVGEIERTSEAANALRSGDFKRMGILMNESHDSLRDLYTVSCKELDILVDIARKCKGVYGSRMTGAGFGGCTVTLVETARVGDVIEVMEALYTKKTNIKPSFIVSTPSEGAKIVKSFPSSSL